MKTNGMKLIEAVARLEERMGSVHSDVIELKADVKEQRQDLGNWKVKVAVIGGGVGALAGGIAGALKGIIF